MFRRAKRSQEETLIWARDLLRKNHNNPCCRVVSDRTPHSNAELRDHGAAFWFWCECVDIVLRMI